MKSDSDIVRAFIAVDIPEEITTAIESVTGDIKGAVKGIKWVKSEGIHLTLKFLGNIKKSSMDEICGALAGLCAQSPPITLNLGAPGAFPDIRRPRVVWLGVVGDVDRLLELQKEVDGSLAGLGFEPEKRPFFPHLTIGRVGSRGRGKVVKGLERALEGMPEPVPKTKPFQVQSVHLYKSELTREGAKYTKLKSFSFAGATISRR